MSDDNRVDFELGLDLNYWNTGLNTILSSTDTVDAALQGLADQAGQIGRALGNVGDVSVDVNIDSSELTTAATVISALDSETISIPFDVVDDELTSAQTKVDTLDAETVDVPVDVDDSELTGAQTKIDNLDSETVDIPVETDTRDPDRDLADIKQQLNDLRHLAVIDMSLNLIGKGWDIIQQLPDILSRIPGVGAVGEQAQALNILDAATVNNIDNADQIISSLYISFGLARDEAARFVATLSNTGVANQQLQWAADTLLDAKTAIEGITGQTVDLNTLLNSEQQLIRLGLADSFEQASDIIVAGYQSSLGASTNFLDVVTEFGPVFSSMGFSGQQMFQFLNSGAETGVVKVEQLADGVKSFNDAASQGTQAFKDTLAEIDKITGSNLMDQLDLFQAGTESGSDFMAAVLDGAREYASSQGQTATQGILGNLFGGAASNVGAEAILGLDPNADAFSALEGRSYEAATTIRDNLSAAIQEFGREVEEQAREFLSSDQINLDQKLEDIKNGIRNTLTALQGGENLADALEIGLQIPGFADSVHRFEASIGEFAISILELIAGVQDFLGKDSSGTRQQIASMAAGQLAFNLQVANPDEISGEISRAVDRGVSPENIQSAIGTSVSELLDAGEIEKATELLGQLNEVQLQVAKGLNEPEAAAAQLFLDAYNRGERTLKEMQDAVDAGLLVNVGIDPTQFQDEIDIATKAAKAKFDEAVQGGDLDVAQMVADQIGDSTGLFQEAFDQALSGGNLDLAESLLTTEKVDPENWIDWQAAKDEAKAASEEIFRTMTDFEGSGAVANPQSSILSGDTWKTAITGAQDFNTELDKTNTALTNVTWLNTIASVAGVGEAADKAGKSLGDTFGQSMSDIGAVATEFQGTMDGMATATEDADNRIANAVTGNTMTTSFETLQTVAGEMLPPVADLFSNMADKIVIQEERVTNQTNILGGSLIGLGNLLPVITSTIENLDALATSATAAAQTTENATQKAAAAGKPPRNIPEFASGGIADGIFSAGEHGRELISTDQSVAILNNQSTATILSAVRSVMGAIMGGGGVSSNGGNTYNIYNTFNTASAGVSEDASQRIANRVRGF